MQVFVEPCKNYNAQEIEGILEKWAPLFERNISQGNTVILKPNWLAHCHKYNPNEWLSVITNPEVITAVLRIVLKCLGGDGRVIITDGPQTDSSWEKIMERMTLDRWIKMGQDAGIDVQVMDLRDDEWITKGDVNVYRKKLPGDPMGSTVCDLNRFSEFEGHCPSKRGYYGADYNKTETNEVHSKGNHKYKVSRTIIEAEVFINLPKIKTHKKAGITCSLKNLVGINTYKNWLPHHNEGVPDQGGDQFPEISVKNKAESVLTEQFKSVLTRHPGLGKWFIPVKLLGRRIFGETRNTIRSGNWYGNDTLWRMVLDLNKILLYANPDGSLRQEDFKNTKTYISVVDAIIAGEGSGPEEPDPTHTGLLIGGTNPVAVDAVCAKLMGFDWQKIPSIKNAFVIKRYPICDFSYDDIKVVSSALKFNQHLFHISPDDTFHLLPHFGWTGHIEL